MDSIDIYSHMGIDENMLNEKIEIILDSGQMHKYSIKYQPSYVVNMPFIGQGEGKGNKCGWLRNKNYFFQYLLEVKPEIFSELNKSKIMEGDSPSVDKTFIGFFPEYSDFIGEKLIHHHIGEDGQAVALPAGLHKGYGVVHNSEKVMGITKNGIDFSNHVQENFALGKPFEWSNASDIMNQVLINELYDEIKHEVSIGPKEATETIEDINNEISGYNAQSKFNYGRNLLKNITPKHLLIGGLIISAATGAVFVTKKSGGIGNIAETIRNLMKRSIKVVSENNDIIAFDTGKKIIETIPEVIVSGASEIVKDNMDDISMFRPIFLLFKKGIISKAEFFEKGEEISKITGKNLFKYLRLLKNLHGDKDALRALL